MFNDFFKEYDPHLNINNTLPVARPGLLPICIALLFVMIFLFLGWYLTMKVFIVIAAFVIWFFRDPARPAPIEGFGLSPADGKIIIIEDMDDNPYTNAPAKKVSIFMNVFNVHVNRAPVGGEIERQIYFPGTFINASLDKASENNERNALLFNTAYGKVAMVQIAGLVARRIVSWVHDGDQVQRGQRVGMIRFGSRVDLYLPPEAEVMVVLGQHVSAGWSPIWRMPQSEPGRVNLESPAEEPETLGMAGGASNDVGEGQ